MKTLATALTLMFVAVFAASDREVRIAYFTHQRDIAVGAAARQNYFDVDEEIWSHTRPDLGDLRLYAGEKEIPYRLAEERATSAQTDRQAKILQPGKVAGNTSFVVEVPGDDDYNRVNLRLDTKNFIARATVEGTDDIHATRATRMGQYTLYDFTREGLGSSTTLKLPDSRFRFLRITLSKEVPPDHLKSASVTFREERKAGYRAIAASSRIENKNKETIISWDAPKNVPLDRVVFAVDQVNFLRNVRVQDADGNWVGSGQISRVKMVRSGRTVESNNLAIDTDGARSRAFKATISDGDDPPLQLKAVTPQFITRRIYFDPRGERALRLYYGDEKLSAPSYEYAKLFVAERDASPAQPGAGMHNPAYTGRPDERPWSERHPALLWATMIIVIAGLGAVALRGLVKSS